MEDSDASYKLYVSQLLPTTDEDLIYAVFGQENLKNVEIMPDPLRKDGTKVAILTFLSAELAEQSKMDYDEFVVDDGELSKPMKIVFFAERSAENRLLTVEPSVESSIENDTEIARPATVSPFDDEPPVEQIARPSSAGLLGEIGSRGSFDQKQHDEHKGKAGNLWSAQIVSKRSGDGVWDSLVSLAPRTLHCTHSVQSDPLDAQLPSQSPKQPEFEPLSQLSSFDQLNVEVDEFELSQLIDNYVHSHRINYAELHSVEDLWRLVHQATSHVGWQPEQILKAAMLGSLQNAVHATDAHWWQTHVEFLIRLWKKEVEQEASSRARRHARHMDGATPSSPFLTLNGGTMGDNEAVVVAIPPTSPTLQALAVTSPALNSKTTAMSSADQATTATTAKPSEPAATSAPSKKRKSGGSGGKRALIELMGVGAFLANVQKENAASLDEKAVRERAENGGRRTSSKKRRRSRSVDRGHRGRSSSCESGEASSTTSGDEDDDDNGGYRATLRTLAAKAPPPPPPPPQPPRNRSERRRALEENLDGEASARRSAREKRHHDHRHGNDQHASSATSTTATAATGAPSIAQSQQAAFMAGMMHLMPMMMQMMQQQQMMAANPQNFQQQFAQLYQQIQTQMGGVQASSANSSPAMYNQMMEQMAQMAQQRLVSTPQQVPPTPQLLLQQQQSMPQQGYQQIGSASFLAPPYAHQQAPPYPNYR